MERAAASRGQALSNVPVNFSSIPSANVTSGFGNSFSNFTQSAPTTSVSRVSGGADTGSLGDAANPIRFSFGTGSTQTQTQRNVIPVTVAWDTTKGSPYDIVFIEASYDEEGQRAFLTSSAVYLGSATVDVPTEYFVSGDVKIIMRTNNTFLGEQLLTTGS